MIDNDPKAQGARPESDQPQTKSARARYQRPVLAHLGSVNRLTLSISAPTRTDGMKNVKVVP
jgi:hypothetical protein